MNETFDECDECGEKIPGSDSSMFSNSHKVSCSLHQESVIGYLPGHEKLKERTAEERLKLIQKWSSWFYNHTESFEPGNVGMQLSYLWAAIANGQKIEVEVGSSMVDILRIQNVPESDPIWEYIDVAPNE